LVFLIHVSVVCTDSSVLGGPFPISAGCEFPWLSLHELLAGFLADLSFSCFWMGQKTVLPRRCASFLFLLFPPPETSSMSPAPPVHFSRPSISLPSTAFSISSCPFFFGCFCTVLFFFRFQTRPFPVLPNTERVHPRPRWFPDATSLPDELLSKPQWRCSPFAPCNECSVPPSILPLAPNF